MKLAPLQGWEGTGNKMEANCQCGLCKPWAVMLLPLLKVQLSEFTMFIF